MTLSGIMVKATVEGSLHLQAQEWSPMSATPIVHKKPGPKPRPAADRFWDKVNKTDTCWLWTASCSPTGYGVFRISQPVHKLVSAHRWAYEQVHGPIPAGLQIDHLCRIRHCVNPDHLEAVTQKENLQRGKGTNGHSYTRKTHCKHGHMFNCKNTQIRPDGSRRCRVCNRIQKRARRQLKRRQYHGHAQGSPE